MNITGKRVQHISSLLYRLPGLRVNPQSEFWSHQYLRHTQRRLEHLALLGLPLADRTVLEVGAGIGDHTSFFIDRGCQVITTDGRPENVELLRKRYPGLDVRLLDLNRIGPDFREIAEVVYCYGTLYHLERPAEALEFLGRCCHSLLLLETCVSFGNEETLNPCKELASNPSQSVSGIGCRPTRAWVYAQLKRHFSYVYLPITQPWHEEFPLDWTFPPDSKRLTRAIFVASTEPINNSLLSEQIPAKQGRY